MALRSKLFQRDDAFEACLVKDSAHIQEGATGPHVSKIQFALLALDNISIEQSEIAARHYGRSTAAGVLAYKRKRSIINRAYQTTADNIVGKMTILSLDSEMATAESKGPLRGCATDIGGGGGGGGTSTRSSLVGGRQLEFAPARLNVSFQEALLANEVIPGSSLRTVLLVERATKLLAPFNLKLSTRFLASFTHPFTVGEKDDVDVRTIRKAADKAATVSPSSLLVIFCHLRGTKSTATSQGELTGITGFKNFVLMNKDRTHPDNGTLLHEMIHCSADRFMNDLHDEDQNSVYSRGDNRNLLRDEHAKSLNDAVFKS